MTTPDQLDGLTPISHIAEKMVGFAQSITELGSIKFSRNGRILQELRLFTKNLNDTARDVEKDIIHLKGVYFPLTNYVLANRFIIDQLFQPNGEIIDDHEVKYQQTKIPGLWIRTGAGAPHIVGYALLPFQSKV